MAIFYRNQIASGPGVFQLGGSIDGIYITAKGGQVSTNTDAIIGLGSNNVVTVYGFVEGELSGIRLGDDVNQDGNHTVHIGKSGDVYGRVDGIHIDAHDSNVRNDGAVFGRETGIELNASIGTSRLVNSGTILSDTEGIRSTGAQTLIIENTGMIFGLTRAIATFGGATALITNTGEIVGEIYLDSGNDVYNGTNGRVSGHISCFGGNDTVYAGVDNDYIDGMGGNDILNGGLGADRMIGGSGNDTFYVDNIGDLIVEGSGEGSDIVATTISYRLAAGASVERMNTTSQGGASAINLTGNEFTQTLIGNAGDNRLEGREGNDTLYGLGGKDTFVFNTKLGATNIDTIADFNVADDRFLLSDAVFKALNPGALASGYFRANTTGLAQDANDHIIYETDTGKLFYDADGLGGAAGIQFAKLAVGLSLTNADFAVA
ncbi:calcium-binding protein [Mesorhizobium sp. ASY16-5R]|uniref:calcium-binding protein n=1 Tax=Mesorhizobium sp. ASY16-5R TaxID=3445772 RepID=UPI003F9EF0CC